MNDYKLILTAETDVHVDVDTARQWFLGLKEHPERYAFASHKGFYFIEGDFGEVGARFYTLERFRGIETKLTFTLTEITSDSFTFVLNSPIRNIKGKFTLTERERGLTTIGITVFGRTKRIERLFTLKPLSQAVQKQISGEVQNIKISMESAAYIGEE